MSRPKGFKHTEKTKKKLSEQKIGNKNPEWKGNDIGYGTLHDWVNRWKGKAIICQECGKKEAEWANVDHKYKRKLSDFIPLCDKCHRDYDKEKGIWKYNGPFTKGHIPYNKGKRKYKIKCKFCKKEIQTSFKNQKYCNLSCSAKYRWRYLKFRGQIKIQ